jgi:hypothetical protein
LFELPGKYTAEPKGKDKLIVYGWRNAWHIKPDGFLRAVEDSILSISLARDSFLA